MRVCALDPGTSNCAMARVLVRNKSIVIEGTTMLHSTLTSIVDNPAKQLRAFIATVETRFQNSDALYAERFQSRGHGGNTIEEVNMMMGALALRFRQVNPVFITASTWKNWVNRNIDLKEEYTRLGLKSTKSPKAIHEFDAVLIALFGACKQLDVTPFGFFADGKKYNQFVDQFMACPKLKN